MGMLMLSCLFNVVQAQDCFPQGTRWIELRLDTTKYQSWLSEERSAGVYIPNYEKVEYYVQGDSVVDFGNSMHFQYVWKHTKGSADSIVFVIVEQPSGQVSVTKTYEEVCNGKREIRFQYPAMIYDFDWHEGEMLYYEDMAGAACTCFPTNSYTFGVVENVRTGSFGTHHELAYMDIDTISTYFGGTLKGEKHVSAKLIQGIGVTCWDAEYCVFGPAYPEEGFPGENTPSPNHYRSLLVHFERGGEVLYDLWPNEKGELVTRIPSPREASGDGHTAYDLQGRKVTRKPSRGLYIIGGKKRVVK